MCIARLRFLRRSQKGMALGMAAVMLPLLMVVMAFAVDIGLATTAQSRLESAVNQAADAAARRLPDEVGADATARSVALLALADVASFGTTPVVEVTTGPDTLRIDATMRANAFFGVLVGRTGYDISARARRALATP
jgi:Flp pilus assembly protein TadG